MEVQHSSLSFKSGFRVFLRVLALVVFIFASTYYLAAQPQLIPVNTASNQYPITFTDPAQRVITIRFNEEITNLGNTSGWSITVGGSAATFTGPIFDPGDHSIIQLQLSTAITYANRNSVRVTYNRASSTASPKLGGASGEVNSFGPVTAVNNLVINCDAFDLSKYTYDLHLTEICAPVDVSYTTAYYILTHYVNSIHYDPKKITIRTWWGDGSNDEKYNAELSPGVFQWTFNHTYPDNPSVCYWNSYMAPGIANVGYCVGGGLRKTFDYQNHAEDDEGDGRIGFNTDTVFVCIGHDFSEIFSDATYFNCNPLTEPNFPNDGRRDIRFTYGTNHAPGDRIQNVLIDGNVVSFPYQTGVITYDSIRANGVPAPSGYASTLPVSHIAAVGPDAVGQIFEIMIENWNPCNPYDIFETNTPNYGYVYIKIVDGPLANAGPDDSVCAGEPYNMNGSVNNAISSNWTTLGDGTFSNATSPSTAVYNAGTADLAAGYVDLVLHAYGTGMCPEHTDTMRLTFDPLPAVPTISISAGSNGFCDNDSQSVTLSSTVSPNGTYLWLRNGISTGVTTQTITLNDYTQSGNYTVTVFGNTTNQCPRSSASFTVTIYQPATTTNPENQTVCQGSNTSFSITPGGGARSIRWQRSNNGGSTWTNITSSTAPNDGCTYSGYTSGTLTISSASFAMNNYQYRARLTTTTGGCVTESEAATLTVNPTASISSQPGNSGICELGNTSFSVSASIPATYNITGYQWQRRKTSGSFENITAAMDEGIYSNFTSATLNLSTVPRSVNNYRYRVVIYSTGDCSITSAYGILSVHPLADITSHPQNRSVCAESGTTFTVADDGYPSVTARQWQVSTNGGSTWSNLSNGGVYSGVTTSTLTLTNIPASYNSYRYRCRLTTYGPCEIFSNAGILTVHTLPQNRTVNATDSWLCYNTGTQINLVSSENSIVYQLRTGSTNIGSTQTGNGSTLAFPTGNLTATTTYNIYAAKTTTIGSSTRTCYLQMSNTPTVNVNPNITIIDLNHPDICFDELIDLPSAAASGGTNNFTYAWTGTGGYTSNVQNPAPFSPSATGSHSYTVVATDNGFRTASADNTVCTVSDNITFTVNPLPAINMSLSDPSICLGQTATITLANSVSGTRYQLRLDSDNSNVGSPVNGTGGNIVFNVAPTATTTYNVLATITATGCNNEVTDKSTVTVNPLPEPDISGANNVCQTDEEIYTTPYVAGHTYNWSANLGTIVSTNANSVTIRWNTVGNGSVTVTETITATGCVKTSTPYAVTVNPGPPTAAPTFVSGATNICRNGSLVIDVSDVATAVEYIWDFSWMPGTSNAVTPTSQITIDLAGIDPGSYTVTVAGSNGCGTGPWMNPAHAFNINDIPQLATLSNTVCSDYPSAITFSISNAGPTITGLTYNITSINMNSLPASAGEPTTGTGFVANVIADDAYTNKTSANVDVIYRVVPVSQEGCTGNPADVRLTVMPEPVLAQLSTSKCSDAALGFDLAVAAGSSAAASYNITAINSNGLTASAGAPATGTGLAANVIADDAWRNTTNAPVDVVYSIVPVGTNLCTGDTYTMTITVNPEPVSSDITAIRCSDSPLDLNFAVVSGSVAAASYNITSINSNGLTASAGNPATGTGFAANAIADDAWTNTTNAPVSVVYTVVPVSAADCQGEPFTVSITVNPEPSLASLSNEVCSDDPSGITLAVAVSSIPAATYNITNINDGGLIASAGSPAVGNGQLADVIADDAWTNKTNSNVNVVYTVVPVSGDGCPGNPVDVTLTVKPEPVLANLNRSICSDAAFGFNLSLALGSSPAASYNITAINSNGLTASAGNPSTGNNLPADVIADDAWTNTTNAPVNVVYSIVPVGVNGCSGDTYTMTITINPEPVLANLNTTKCSDEAFGFSLATAAGSVAAARYNITEINSNGLSASAGFPATGDGLAANVIANDAWTNTTSAPVDVVYTVVPVSASDCPGKPMTVTVTINPEPVLADLNTSLCSDAALNFNLATAAGSVPAATYNIISINSNGLTASAGTPAAGNGLPANVIADDAWRNTTAVPVNVIYTVVPVSAANCEGNPATVTIQVNPEPVMATSGTTVCSRGATGITLAVNSSGVAAATYTITAINSNGLTASAGAPATGTGLAANVIADDAWINTTSANVNVVYTVVPVSAEDCEGNPADITIVVKPEPVITPGQTTSACSGNALDFGIGLDNFTNPAAGVTFTWSAPVLNPSDPAFTGGTARGVASSANITDTFINTLGQVGTATYTITPYYNGCTGQPVDVVVYVGSEPVLDPNLGDYACSNTAIGLVLKEATGSVTPSHYNIISVNYESGLTPAATNAVIPDANAAATFLSGDIYENYTGVNKSVTYRVQPVLAPDCFGDPVDVVIIIRPQPVVVPGQVKTVCSGVAINHEILLVPANTPAGTLFNWNAPTISNGTVQGTAGVDVAADPAGTLHITDMIDNLSSDPITATYNIIPVSADGCSGNEIPVVITINPEPLPPVISGRTDLCVDDYPVPYTVTSTPGSTYYWTVDPAVGIKALDFNTSAILMRAAATAGTGNITVYETNSLGCSGDPFSLPVQVWESAAPEDITGDPVVCAYTTHTYSISSRVGSTYSWTLPGGAAIIGDPSAHSISVLFGNVGGTIMVRETSIGGCVTNHNPFSVTVNPLPSANISNGGTMCEGESRPLSVSFIGTAPFEFTYAINGVNQTPVHTSDNPYIINATQAGTYSIVSVSDATGCTAAGTGSTTITYFPKPTGIISGVGELCRGSSATLTMTFTGVAPYNFSYGDGVNPDIVVTNHPNNVYTVSVSPLVTSTYTLTSLTDHNNCEGELSGSATINVNQPPSLSLAGTNLTCYNVPTGEIDMTITGGTEPFGISWTGPNGFTAPTEDISGLSEGYYAVTVNDSKGCSATANITLTQPQPLNATVDSSPVTCYGAADGSIIISGASGGYGTYEYTIDDGLNWQPAGTFNDLAPGNYEVRIRDAANPHCEKTLNPNVVITQPAELNAVVTTVDVSCNGSNNGRITISNPVGGYGTYDYSIDGGHEWQLTESFSDLSPGTYDIRIRDRAYPLCIVVLPAATINQADPITADVASVNVTCNGANDGIITISNQLGGTGVYTYSVNGGSTWQTTPTFNGLTPGTYDVRIRDVADVNCEVVLDPDLEITQPDKLTATVASTAVTCYGANDGTITISDPQGGYGTYEFSINGGSTWQSSGNFTGLAPGYYNVITRDEAHPSCIVVLNNSLQITQPNVLYGVIATTMVSCNGADDGIITINNPTGGYGTYEFSNDGGSTWQAGSSFNDLAPGSYDVRMRDAANQACETILNPSVLITEPAVLSAVVDKTDISCFGANDGRIVISSPSGGYGNYDYSINGGIEWLPTGSFSNLSPGFYDVRIRDRAHQTCVVILDAALEITEPAVLSASVDAIPVTCNGANDGRIEITGATGGYGSYQYTINGGAAWQNSGIFNYLAPGSYDVRIRDAANIACSIILDPALEITQPAKLSATVDGTPVTCYGAGDGTITITDPQGGYGTYQYSINGGLNWQDNGNFSSLVPGYYNVQIRDAAHTSCVVVLNGSFRISEPAILAANVTRTNLTCFGADDGTISITNPTGGYGTYEYSIDGGSSWHLSGSFTGLTPGSYDVQIRDLAQPLCVIVLNPDLEITEPDELSATVLSTAVTCYGANNGTISITNPSGGYGTYQYSINGTSWQGYGTFSNLSPASYEVSIRDAANHLCVVVLDPAMEITEPAQLAATIGSTNVSCFGGNDGTITITGATGGYGTYDYSINGGGSWNSTGIFTNLMAGSYNILIRDAAHTECIIVLNNAYLITQPAMLSATVSKTEVSCNGFDDGTITISNPLGGYGTYDYSIDGGSIWQTSDGSFSNLSPGSYDVRMRDAEHTDCSVILYPNLLITEPLPLEMSTTGDIVLDCFGDTDGMGTFYASGGTLPYTFVVDENTTGGTVAAPGFNSLTFYNAGAGLVRVTVVDVNGCSAQAVINITQPDDLTPGSVEDNQVLCYGDNPDPITEVTGPAGGPGSYVYQWQTSTNAAGPFINIAANANESEYTPPSGATYTQYYRRMVTSGTCLPVYSNVVEVLVNPRPVAFLTGGATICPGESAVIKVTMLSGTGPFRINIANHGEILDYNSGDDIIVTPAVSTTYSLISVMDANGCDVTEPSPGLSGTAEVIVSDLPVITSFTPSPAVCEFTPASFRVTATGTNLSYQWFVDDNSGTGPVPVTDGGSYSGSLTPTLQVFNTVRGMSGYVYHVEVSGCGTTVTSDDATLTVNTAPEITLHPKDSTICLGQDASFEVSAEGSGVNWQWYVNKGTGFELMSDDSYFSGSTTATLAVTDAQLTFNGWIFRAVASGVCGVPVNTNFAILRVISPPSVTTQPQPRTVCENSSTNFIANGEGYTSLQWQLNTGSGWTDISDDATYLGATTQQLSIMNVPVSMNGYRYRLALSTICSTTYSNEVVLTVNENPVVDFSGIDPLAACGGVPLVIDGNPTGGSGTWSQHRWTGDVGPLNSYTVQAPTFSSYINGSYVLNYRVTDSNGCTANDDLTVTVDYPSAEFTQDVEYGCTPLTVNFSKDMTGIEEWWWDFGDGSPLDSSNENPVHTFVNNDPGSIEYFIVKLRVRSAGGCFAEQSIMITVYPSIDASFTPSTDVVCSGNSISFTALPGATRYFWDYGDGISGYGSNLSTHPYINLTTAPVVHTVRLTTTSFYNCVDTKTFDITVMPTPLPGFTANPVNQVFDPAGNPVQFSNTTNEGAWDWLWRFGDNSTSTEENPHHNYTDVGTYTVMLIASNEHCSDSVSRDIMVVPPPPVANFDTIPSGCAPLYIDINNTSLHTEVPGTTYHWDFGDGSVSTAKNPTYTYFTPGIYRIELVVNGPGGTSNYSQVVEAWPSPKAYFEITPPMVYVNDERVRCFNLSQGASSYLWHFGDGDTSKVKEPYHRYMEEGVYDITLWAYSENGCSDMYKLSPGVTVEPVGEIRFATVFTPNKTGPIERTDLPTGGIEIDQFFFPPIRQKVTNYKLQVFNRLGVLIFESHDINIPWNGYYKGNLCQQGVYVWYVEGKYADGQPFKMVGNVTLLH
jgi:PKD repeat protein